jgi:DNA-binding GntR family transcriptional regulator
VAAAEQERDSTAVAFERLREAILTGDLEGGKIYSRVELEALLQVGRTPLREALRLVQTEGLVRLDSSRRVRIAPLRASDLEQLFILRLTIEPMAVALSTPYLTEADLDQIDESLQQAFRWAKEGDFGAFRLCHAAFHLHALTGAPARLRHEATLGWQHTERYFASQIRMRSDYVAAHGLIGQDEHETILLALRARAPERAAMAVAEHLGRAAVVSLAALEVAYDPARLRYALRHVTRGWELADSR